MGKKVKHISEPAYWTPGPKGQQKLAGVSKGKALKVATARVQRKLDPKQLAKLAKASKGKGKGKGKGKKGRK